MRDQIKSKVNDILGEGDDDEAFARVRAERDKDPLKRAHDLAVLVINSTNDKSEINRQARRYIADFKDVTFPNVTAAIEADRKQQKQKGRWITPGNKLNIRGIEFQMDENNDIRMVSTSLPASLHLAPHEAQHVLNRLNGVYHTEDEVRTAVDRAMNSIPMPKRKRK